MKRSIMALGAASLSLGLALPFVLAQDKPGTEKSSEKCSCEEVSLSGTYMDVTRRVPDALIKAGLIYAGEIDWNSLRSRGMTPHGSMPGETPRLDAVKATNVKTFLIADEKMVNGVFEDAKHGFWIGRLVVCDDGGKSKLFYFKPTLKLEELKKHGIISEEKAAEHMKHAEEFERRIENAVNTLKTEK